MNQLKFRPWLDKSYKQNKDVQNMVNEYRDIVLAKNLDDIQVNNFLNSTSFMSHWSECLDKGNLKVLKSLLDLERGSFVDANPDFASYIVDLLTELEELEVDTKLNERAKEVLAEVENFSNCENWKVAVLKLKSKSN